MIADTLLIQKSSVYCYGFLNFIGKEKIYCWGKPKLNCEYTSSTIQTLHI